MDMDGDDGIVIRETDRMREREWEREVEVIKWLRIMQYEIRKLSIVESQETGELDQLENALVDDLVDVLERMMFQMVVWSVLKGVFREC